MSFITNRAVRELTSQNVSETPDDTVYSLLTTNRLATRASILSHTDDHQLWLVGRGND